MEQRDEERFAGNGGKITAQRPKSNFHRISIPELVLLISVFSLRWPPLIGRRGERVEITEREFERFREIDDRLITTFSEKSYLEDILKKSGLSLSELREIVKLIRDIETRAQKLLSEEIGVRVISGEEIGVKVLTFVAREEKKRKKLFSVIKAGVVKESTPRRVHSQLIINLLGPQWSVVEKRHHPEIYAMIIAQSLGSVALAYPEVCAKLAIDPAKLAGDMVKSYVEVFDA